MKSQVIKSLTASNRPDLIPSELAKLTEMEHKETVNKELIGKINQQKIVAQNSEVDRYRKALGNVSNYDSAAYWLRHQYNNELIKDIVSIVPFETALAEIPKDPAGLEDWKKKNALGIEKYIEQNKPNITTRNTGTTTELLSTPGLGGSATVVPGSQATMQMTPGQVQTAADALAGRQQSERHFQAGGYTYDLDRGIRIDRNGIATPLMQQAPPAGGVAVGGGVPSNASVSGGIPTGRGSAAGLVPLGPKPEKATESYLKEVKGVINTNDAINNLKQMVSNFTPADMVNPARRAEIDQAHKTAVLLAKEMFNLGVLNGGDQKILEQVIPDPIAFSKGLVPIETIRKNLDSATTVVNRMNNTLSKVHKQPLLNLDAGTLNAPSPSAPPIQSFRRPD